MTDPSFRIIAGHKFAEGLHGLTCLDCGRRFTDLTAVRETDIGADGWAAFGSLSRDGYDSIRAEVERVWALTKAVGSGAGVGGMAPGSELEMEGFR